MKRRLLNRKTTWSWDNSGNESSTFSVTCFNFSADGEHHLSEETKVSSPRFHKIPEVFRETQVWLKRLVSKGWFRELNLTLNEEQSLFPIQQLNRIWVLHWKDSWFPESMLYSWMGSRPCFDFWFPVMRELKSIRDYQKLDKLDAPVFLDAWRQWVFTERQRAKWVTSEPTFPDGHPIFDTYKLITLNGTGTSVLKKNGAIFLYDGPLPNTGFFTGRPLKTCFGGISGYRRDRIIGGEIGLD